MNWDCEICGATSIHPNLDICPYCRQKRDVALRIRRQALVEFRNELQIKLHKWGACDSYTDGYEQALQDIIDDLPGE